MEVVKPVRLQRRRTTGYDIQAVSRALNGLPCIVVTRPSKWGNPFNVDVYGRELSMKLFRGMLNGAWDASLLALLTDSDREAAVKAREAFLKRIGPNLREALKMELGGRNLGCYCPISVECHADILLEFAGE
jgi:Domain of unknown function (DUF4326)